MAKFSFDDYQEVVKKAQNSGTNATKVGFFKLKDDGEEALVRINCSGLAALDFASVHTVQADGKWMKISCLNPVGGAANNKCALCKAIADGDTEISKSNKKVYVQMMVAYRDPVTKQFAEAIPVIWERPALFSRDLANKLRDYGDLRKILLKVTRNGVAGDMKTTYSLDYAVPTVFKPEIVPEDFSAFANFNIAKHSYWEKTPEELAVFVATGSFPETTNTDAPIITSAQPVVENVAPVDKPAAAKPVYQQPVYQSEEPQAVEQQAVVQPEVKPEAKPAEGDRPARDFTGFSF